LILKNKVFAFSLFILLANISFSQIISRKVFGKIFDPNSTGIEYMNVLLMDKDSSEVLAYSFSESSGSYSIDIDTKDSIFFLVITGLDYTTISKKIIIQKELRQDITLESNPILINETIVKGKRSVVARGDTITYNADSFRDSTERNLEELLEKLPGFEINKETGQIEVNGDVITKVVVDGDDLTGHNYSLLTKNIGAEVINKIQVIDHFQSNPLLRGVKQSNEKIINVTIKDNFNPVFGKIDAHLGWKKLDLGLNLFTVTKNIKSLSFLKANNIGEVISYLRDDISESKDADEEIQTVSTINQYATRFSSLDAQLPTSNSIDKKASFNKSGIAFSSQIINLSPDSKVITSITYNKENVEKLVQSNYKYYLAQDTLILNEENKPTLKFNGINIGAKFIHNYKNKLRFFWDNSLSNNSNNLLSIYSLNSDNSNNNDFSKVNDLSSRLGLTFKVKNNAALVLNATIDKNSLSENTQYFFSAPQIRQANLFSNFDSIHQKMNHYGNTKNVTIRYLTKIKNFQLNIYSSANNQKIRLNPYLDYYLANKNILNQYNGSKSASISINELLVGSNINYVFKKIRLWADIYLSHSAVKNPSYSFTKNVIYASKNFNLDYNFSKDKALQLYYYDNQSNPTYESLNPYYTVIDARSNMINQFNYLQANNTNFGITFKNKINDDQKYYAKIDYRKIKNGALPSIDFFGPYSDRSFITNLSKYETFNSTIRWEKYIKYITGRIVIKPTFIASTYPISINKETSINKSKLKEIDLRYKSAISMYFSFLAGFKKGILDQSRNGNTFQNTDFENQFLDLTVKLFKRKVFLSAENELFKFSNEQKRFFYSSLSAHYLSAKKYSIYLRLMNVFNNKTIVSQTASEFYLYQQVITVQPRFLLLGISTSF
jgi:hypothetical protein